MDDIEALRRRVKETEQELDRLKEELRQAEAAEQATGSAEEAASQPGATPWKWPLPAEDYERYARQLIIPQVGVPGPSQPPNPHVQDANTPQGQLRLRKASVLIVGAGGLGCPAAAYLAGAGVGTIGLADGDVVEMSNLHRQVAHSMDRVGMLKVDSAICFLKG